jgi:hypothetical protein
MSRAGAQPCAQLMSSYHFISSGRWRLFEQAGEIDGEAAYQWLVFCAAKQPMSSRVKGFCSQGRDET